MGTGLECNVYEKAIKRTGYSSRYELVVHCHSSGQLLPSTDTDVHVAQCLTYLKFSKKRLGYVLNFNVTLMKRGIKRLVLESNSFVSFVPLCPL